MCEWEQLIEKLIFIKCGMIKSDCSENCWVRPEEKGAQVWCNKFFIKRKRKKVLKIIFKTGKCLFVITLKLFLLI